MKSFYKEFNFRYALIDSSPILGCTVGLSKRRN